jgi:hypothetical protein
MCRALSVRFRLALAPCLVALGAAPLAGCAGVTAEDPDAGAIPPPAAEVDPAEAQAVLRALCNDESALAALELPRDECLASEVSVEDPNSTEAKACQKGRVAKKGNKICTCTPNGKLKCTQIAPPPTPIPSPPVGGAGTPGVPGAGGVTGGVGAGGATGGVGAGGATGGVGTPGTPGTPGAPVPGGTPGGGAARVAAP